MCTASAQGSGAAAEPEWPPYVEPEFPPLPPADWAPWLVDHIQRQRDGREQPLVLNLAGEHSSGWEILDVDEENLITWCGPLCCAPSRNRCKPEALPFS